MNFAVLLIRSLPLAVLTHPLYAWEQKTLVSKAPLMGLERRLLFLPRRKRLGY